MLNQKRISFVAALLVTTAFTAPAFAEIEIVTVSVERKVENIQTTPVAVTALSGADLKSKQVSSFRDLQFHVPSVTYTKSNFGGAQFQIRGITTQFGLGAAIAQNENDIYLEAPNLVTGQYFDVDQVAVARGPQSTSYGRAATGGAVNVITSKPNLDEFQARASFDYGTYNTMKPEFMVNVPLIDNELGIRVAGLARDRLGTLLAIGVTVLFTVHVFVNIAMTIGLVPITGIPLPFISYGGSFVLSCCLLQGLVQSVWRFRKDFT